MTRIPPGGRAARGAAAAVASLMAAGGLLTAAPAAVAVPAPSAITVGEDGYTTIAQAVAAIADGGVITVPAGDYRAEGRINVSKTMTLNGAQAGNPAGPGDPRADASASTESVVDYLFINAPGVRVEGFEFGSSGIGVTLQGTGDGARVADDAEIVGNRFVSGTTAVNDDHGANALIQGNAFVGGVDRGIVFQGADNGDDSRVLDNVFDVDVNGVSAGGIDRLLVEGNDFRRFDGERGVGLRGTDNTVRGNSFVVGSGAEGAVVLQSPSSGSTVEGNFFTGDGVAVNVAVTDAGSASGNSFANTGPAVENLSAEPFDATANWWGHLDGPYAGQTIGDVDTTGWLTPAFLSVHVSAAQVDHDVTSVGTSYELANPAGVSVEVVGADGLAVGANDVVFTATLTVAGRAVASAVHTLTVTRAAAPTPAQPPAFVPDVPQSPDQLPDGELLPSSAVSAPPPAQGQQRGLSVDLGSDSADSWYYVVLYSAPTAIGWVLADARGVVTFALPDSFPGGTHTVALFDAAGDVAAVVPGVVVPAAAPAGWPGSVLPATGSPSPAGTLTIAGALILAGVAASVLGMRSRRRRRG